MAERRPFSRYISKTLVETGSYRGDGIQTALDCGYENVYSYEISRQLHDLCKCRFQGDSRVHLFHKSSRKMAEDIREVKGKITFWLDAHYSQDSASYQDKPCPIMEELEQLKLLPEKNHFILIDDLRLFGTVEFSFLNIDDVKAKILEINPKYKFTLETGFIARDVLVAYIEDEVIPVNTPFQEGVIEDNLSGNLGTILEVGGGNSALYKKIDLLRKNGLLSYENYTIVDSDDANHNIRGMRDAIFVPVSKFSQTVYDTVITHGNCYVPIIANAKRILAMSQTVPERCTRIGDLYIYPPPVTWNKT